MVGVVTRLAAGLEGSGGWREATLDLPTGPWRDALTGRTVEINQDGAVHVGDLLADLPVALLVRDATG